MNIGAAAAATGVSAKMIRHYEAIGLLHPPARQENSYRDYSDQDIHELRFIGRSRKLGFSMTQIAELLALWRNKKRPSRDVRRIAESHLRELESRAAELHQMIATLRDLVESCHGDNRPACPILEDLSASAERDERLTRGSPDGQRV